MFTVLADWDNSPRIDMSPHSDTLFWLRSNQSLLFYFYFYRIMTYFNSSKIMSLNCHSRSYQVLLCRTQQRKASFSSRTTVDSETAYLRQQCWVTRSSHSELPLPHFIHHDKACISTSIFEARHLRCCSMSPTLDVLRCLLVTYLAALRWSISIVLVRFKVGIPYRTGILQWWSD
jgi:hypothetical protein